MVTKRRVHWSSQDIEKLAKAAGRIRAERPSIGWGQLIDEAQKACLEPEFRRNLASMTQVPGLKEAILRAQDEAEKLPEVKPGMTSMQADGGKQDEPRPTQLPDLELDDVSLDELLEAVGKRLVGVICKALVDNDDLHALITLIHGPKAAAKIPDGPSVSAPHRETPKVTHDPRRHGKPKVLVVGLLADQANHIRRAWDELIDLRFVKSQGYASASAQASEVDLVVLMTKFIDHAMQDTVKSRSDRVTLCHGGISSLSDVLSGFLDKLTSKQPTIA